MAVLLRSLIAIARCCRHPLAAKISSPLDLARVASALSLISRKTHNRKLHDHIFDHLKAKVGNFQSVIAEWGYNMLEGCKRYADDPEIEFFKLMLEGQISEEVLHDMNAVVFRLFDQLQVNWLEVGCVGGRPQGISELSMTRQPRHRVQLDLDPASSE